MKRALLWMTVMAAPGSLSPGFAQNTPAAPITEYAAGALAPADYRVISHIPASQWLTALTPRTFADQPAARAALLNEAARRGGDGVINVHCLRAGGVGAGTLLPGHYCQGSVIKRVK